MTHRVSYSVLPSRVAMLSVVVMLFFVGCSSKNNVAGQDRIIEDIVKKTDFEELDINIDEFEIIKRKTDVDAKRDEVYVSIYGKNNILEANRNYTLVYELYNDGWLCESIVPYHDEEHYDRTSPIGKPQIEEVQAYIDTLDIEAFSGISDCEVKGYSVGDITVLNEYPEYCEYVLDVVYNYYCFDIVSQIYFYYSFIDQGAETWGWHTEKYEVYDLYAELNEGILGHWEDVYEKYSFWGDGLEYRSGYVINISSVSSDTCYADFYWRAYSPGDNVFEDFWGKGSLNIDYISSSSGKRITDIYLRWAEEKPNEVNDLILNMKDGTLYAADTWSYFSKPMLVKSHNSIFTPQYLVPGLDLADQEVEIPTIQESVDASAHADGDTNVEDVVFDNAGVLSETQKEQINDLINHHLRNENLNIFIVSENTYKPAISAEAFTDDYMDYTIDAENGILLAVFPDDREIYISTVGIYISKFTDDELGKIIDHITPNLSGDDYFRAFYEFVMQCYTYYYE